jgi:DNA-binding transcriptional LysR family regulator
MELRNLRAFVAIADEGHFGRAAARLNLTQPAITQRIQVLERELGAQILARNAREVTLTPAGELLVEHARALVQIEDRALRALRDFMDGAVGCLRISYLTLWDSGLPANIVAEFRRRYPAVRLEMTSGYSQVNVDRLLAGEVDFAFVGTSIGEQGRIAIRPLDRHEIVVVAAPSHHLMQMKRVPVESLRGEPMVAISPGVNAPLAAASISWLTKQMGEPPNIVQEEPPDQMAAALAHSKHAVALMTEHRASIARSSGLDYRPLTPAPMIEYGVAFLRGNESPALANLLGTVKDIVPPLPHDLPDGKEPLWRPESLGFPASSGGETGSEPG